jgi:hypothetical protein
MCYIRDMEKMKRGAADDAAAEILDRAITERGLTNKGIERLSKGEIGYNRVRDIRMKLRGPIRLSELIALCAAIGLDPAATVRMIIARADEINSQMPVTRDDSHSSPLDDEQASDDAPLTADEIMTLAANRDENRDMEAGTPRD